MPPGATSQSVEKYSVDPSPAVPVQPFQFVLPTGPAVPAAAEVRIQPYAMGTPCTPLSGCIASAAIGAAYASALGSRISLRAAKWKPAANAVAAAVGRAAAIAAHVAAARVPAEDVAAAVRAEQVRRERHVRAEVPAPHRVLGCGVAAHGARRERDRWQAASRRSEGALRAGRASRQ
jgi:hypothetical protein